MTVRKNRKDNDRIDIEHQDNKRHDNGNTGCAGIPEKVFGKLITLPKPGEYFAIEQVHIVNGKNKAANASAISEYMNEPEQSDFTL